MKKALQTEKYSKLVFLILIILYLVGIIGLNTSLRDTVAGLTPYNLLITAFALFLFHRRWNLKFYIFMIITALAGYLAEVLGVHTGLIFGHYEYGSNLGIKVFDVPLMIGVNWLILIYAVGTMIHPLKGNWVVKSVLGALLMVLIDLPLEPVAMQLDFWQWDSLPVPMQNYVGWYILSLVLLAGYHQLVDYRENRMAPRVYLIMFVFFVVVFLTAQAG